VSSNLTLSLFSFLNHYRLKEKKRKEKKRKEKKRKEKKRKEKKRKEKEIKKIKEIKERIKIFTFKVGLKYEEKRGRAAR